MSLGNKAAIYIYMYKLNNEKLYIGSAFNVSQRLRQHRYRVKVYNGNNMFYNYVSKYG